MQESFQVQADQESKLIKESEDFDLKDKIISDLQQEIVELKAELRRVCDGVNELIEEYKQYAS
jgi:hypothetical protein